MLIRLLIIAIVILMAGAAIAQTEQTTPAEEPTQIEVPAVQEDALVVEASFCTGVEERMPVGETESFSPDVENVYMWCRVTGCQDTTVIKQVWSWNGQEMASVELPVKSPAWRTWGSKKILPEWTGNWEVKIFDADGNVLKSASFVIEAASTQETASTEE